MLINNTKIVFLIVIFSTNSVSALDEFLRSQSILYGISSLANETHTNCSEQLTTIYNAIGQQKFWALKALDASGQPRQGFLYGNNFWLGSKFQCNDISNRKKFEIAFKERQVDPINDFPPFEMRFSIVMMTHNNTLQKHTRLPLEYTIQLGLCLPKSCDLQEINDLLEKYFTRKFLEIQNMYKLHLKIQKVRILEPNLYELFTQPKTIVFLMILLPIIFLTIYATFKPQTSDLLQSFSIYLNCKSLMKSKPNPDSLDCLHGLRFLGMLWVILVHAIFYSADYIENVPTSYRISEGFLAQIMGNATYSADTFFFLSGFLITHLFLKAKVQLTCNLRKVHLFFMMTLKRFLRLTPPYLVLLLFSDVLFTWYKQIAPMFASERPDEMCSMFWWRNLLYINNLFPRKEMCLSWSWYLSADFQFFIVATILLLISISSLRTSIWISFLLILVNVATTAYKSYEIGYIPTMDNQFKYLDDIYDLPWNRIGAYMSGMITCWFLRIKLNSKLHLNKTQKWLCWILGSSTNLWILFTLYTREVSVEFSAFYMGVSRTLWGFGIGWIVVACATGNAGLLDKFLSHQAFIPLSRLTYCAYLINPLIAHIIFLGSDNSYNGTVASFAVIIPGITLMTFYLSFLFYLIFEAPLIQLTKILFEKMSGKRRDSYKSSSQTNIEQS